MRYSDDAGSGSANPLLEDWTGPFKAPPFPAIKPQHFRPAFDHAFAAHRAEIAAIAGNPAPPTFDNTIVALERAGRSLSRIASVFFNLAAADTSDAIEAIERDVAPLLAKHYAEIHLDTALFARIDTLYQQREALSLDAEQARVLERYHTDFRRAGAGQPAAVKDRLIAIGERLATLGTQFSQNVLADENAFALVIESEAGLAGLPAWQRAAAAAEAERRGLPGAYAITLARSSIEPFLQLSERHDLREKVFRAWLARGENDGPSDNRAIAAEMIKLRAEQATLLGFESFAHFRLADTMAKTPDAAQALLDEVWTLARARAAVEEQALHERVVAEGGNFTLAPWDWRYYSEKRRKVEFDLDEAEFKPYLPLDQMIEAAFFTATKLFGLTFAVRSDIALYHPDARAWTVSDATGTVGLFIGDYFARPSKHGGAWMGAYRDQERLNGTILPIIVNVLNFSKPATGEACLLSFEDARTLFHEFGHALHGLLSDRTYPSIAGTNVARDFVEFPSQLYEHWFEQNEILRRFARHHQTGAPMPEALIERFIAARQFNQGFMTVEYTASALVDLAIHRQAPPPDLDIVDFERDTLAELKMPQAIAMRHRLPHFNHVFAGDAYSAGYYSYLWSEVLDADGFAAFTEAGDIFDPDVAGRLRTHVYAAGNSTEPDAAYRAFRGRDASPGPLLKKRGLVDVAAKA